MAQTQIYYHRSCMDGAAAAYIASLCYSDHELIPVQYGDPAPDVAGQHVLIVDFSWPREDMLRMIGQAESFICFDHHKTAQESLEGIPHCTFDMNKCGARLTWESHFPDYSDSPWWLDYIEDRDLWRWKLPDSKEVNAAMRSYGLTPGAVREIAQMELGAMKQQGIAILRFQQQEIDRHVSHAEEIELFGHKILATNATCLFSEIAGRLAEGRPLGATFFVKANGEKVWQLRSKPDGVDVSELAKSRGGGGHKHAAGFTEKI